MLLLLFACTDVAPANQSPSIANTIPDHTLTIRTDSTIDISGYFTDSDGDTLSYGAVSRDPGIVQVVVKGSLLTMTAGDTPTASEIEVWASDPDSARATQSFKVTVKNQTPVVADTIPDHIMGARTDSTIDLSPYFTDPDGDTLSYDVVSQDPTTVGVSVNGSLLTMTAGRTVGGAEIEVRASDPDSARAVQVFEVTVINRAPVVADTIPDHRLGVSADSTIDLSRHFTDPDGDTLSYDVVSHDPATVSVSVKGSLLTMTSGDARGSSEIEVRAFDPDSAQAAQTFRAAVFSTSWRENFDSAGSLKGWTLSTPHGSSIEVDEEDSVLLVHTPTEDIATARAMIDSIVSIERNWTASTRLSLKSGSPDEVCSEFTISTGSSDYPHWQFEIDHFDESWIIFVYDAAGSWWESIADDYFDDPPYPGDYIKLTMSLVNGTMTVIANDSTELASFDPQEQQDWPDKNDPPPSGATGVWLAGGSCYSAGTVIFEWVEIGEVR